MNKRLIMATANPNKIKEINEILENTDFNVISMLETGYEEEIEETGLTLEENALIKARVLHQELGEDVFSEDTGLEVDALNGLPGVKTARFAGEDKDPRENMSLLLEKLKGIDDRSAQFRTCIALILGNKEYLFEGKVRGSISNELQGEGGFGYDPIFIPEGFDRTFGQLSSKIKNEISHRKSAMDQLVEFLEKNK